VTRASGKSRVVLARHSRNRRLADALDRMAFCSLIASPGARHYYDEMRAREKSHQKAVRQLANRWVGILHTCLERDCRYDEVNRDGFAGDQIVSNTAFKLTWWHVVERLVDATNPAPERFGRYAE
jgi:hypothetical protein